MKNISVVIPGADESADIRDLEIEPGTTASNVLHAIDKDNDWQLQRKNANGFLPLAAMDSLDDVSDGEKLFAVPKNIVVG